MKRKTSKREREGNGAKIWRMLSFHIEHTKAVSLKLYSWLIWRHTWSLLVTATMRSFYWKHLLSGYFVWNERSDKHFLWLLQSKSHPVFFSSGMLLMWNSGSRKWVSICSTYKALGEYKQWRYYQWDKITTAGLHACNISWESLVHW